MVVSKILDVFNRFLVKDEHQIDDHTVSDAWHKTTNQLYFFVGSTWINCGHGTR